MGTTSSPSSLPRAPTLARQAGPGIAMRHPAGQPLSPSRPRFSAMSTAQM